MRHGPELHDIAVGFALLTRLPVPVDHARAAARGAGAAWSYPLVGAVLGALAGALGWALLALGVLPGLAAVFVLALQMALTGAMHEDGLADMADGLGGSAPAERLSIMKDSRIGSYGALALGLALLARFGGVAALGTEDAAALPLVLAALGAGSRALMVALMAWLPPARPGGLAATTGRPTPWPALALGLGASLLGLGWAGAGIFAAMALGVAALGALAKARFGGQTGDILGAGQQWAEIIGLALITVR